MEELKKLQERVARLEREIEQLKQKVQTRELVIVDQHGNPKAYLGLDKLGDPLLRLGDAGRRPRAMLCFIEGNPALVFIDAAGTPWMLRVGTGSAIPFGG